MLDPSHWIMKKGKSLREGPTMYVGFKGDLYSLNLCREEQQLWGTHKTSYISWDVAETTMFDENAFHASCWFTKLPLLSYFVRLWS